MGFSSKLRLRCVHQRWTVLNGLIEMYRHEKSLLGDAKEALLYRGIEKMPLTEASGRGMSGASATVR